MVGIFLLQCIWITFPTTDPFFKLVQQVISQIMPWAKLKIVCCFNNLFWGEYIRIGIYSDNE